jgi:soluble lytic murein transglycosylase-like protein
MNAARSFLVFLATLGFVSTSPVESAAPRAAVTAPIPASAAVSLTSDTVRAARSLSALHTSLVGDEIAELAVRVAVESRRTGLPVDLLLAVIQVESSGNAFALSEVGAMGLMQLMPATAEAIAEESGVHWMGTQSLFDPATNLRLGACYLRKLVDRYGDVSTALAAYNWGPTRIASRIRRGEAIPVLYAERVLSRYASAYNGA